MTEPERPRRPWRDVAATFLRLGVTSYGGPAIMGIMQAELQEKRAWVSRERFLEGLSRVNMLPGATATQLAIFIGYARGGWWGGLLAGACFVLPGFFVILGLTIAYAGLGVIPCAGRSTASGRSSSRSSRSRCIGSV
jgi:chromate transporter